MGPLQDIRETWARFLNEDNLTLAFLRRKRWAILAVSVVVLIPCFWHRRIEAGDLASHVYNAWLAQLIEKGQARGLHFAKQWNNSLFDVTLLRLVNVVGFAVAQGIVGSAGVLILLVGSVGCFAVCGYASHRPALSADWDRGPFYLYNGADQLVLYGKRYIGLAAAAFSFGIVCVAVNFFAATWERDSWTPFELPFELYAVTFC